MSKRRINTRKLLSAIAWMLAGIAVVVALVAAISKSNDADCTGTDIRISGSRKVSFLAKQDVLRLMGVENAGAFKGRSAASINLHVLEKKIATHRWVSDVELFFDNDRVLVAQITEREPLARIFTVSGNSFYIDSSGTYLPLAPGKPPVQLPVFTGMPDKLKKNRADSSLLAQVRAISNLLNEDGYWMAQTTQINVTPEKEFELVPLLGNSVVLLGDGGDFRKKFARLGVFYRQVLTRTGFDYYNYINVKFEDQVIGVKGDLISTPVDKNILAGAFADSSLSVKSMQPSNAATAAPESQPVRRTDPDPTPVKDAARRQPKAVMKKVP